MTTAAEALTGIVLAAGEGARFGSPKQLAPLHGKPLLEHAVATMVRYCDDVLVVLGSNAPKIQATLDLHRVEVVCCKNWREGTYASLCCGLDAVGSDWSEVVVVLGDQPSLTAERIDAVRSVHGPIVRALAAGKPSHPVVIRRGAVVTHAALRQAKGIELGALPDVDTPDDLAKQGAHIKRR